MRPLILATALLIVPATGFAQSTVGNMPSNPNAMPAVNGSSAPKVSTSAQTTDSPASTSSAEATSSTHKSTHKTAHKKTTPPQ